MKFDSLSVYELSARRNASLSAPSFTLTIDILVGNPVSCKYLCAYCKANRFSPELDPEPIQR